MKTIDARPQHRAQHVTLYLLADTRPSDGDGWMRPFERGWPVPGALEQNIRKATCQCDSQQQRTDRVIAPRQQPADWATDIDDTRLRHTRLSHRSLTAPVPLSGGTRGNAGMRRV